MAAGGRGVKQEEAATDIEEVKAGIEDVAVEGDAGGGGGGLVVTPWLRGEAGHAWGLGSKSGARNPPLWRGMPHLTPCLVNRCMCPTPMVSTRGL